MVTEASAPPNVRVAAFAKVVGIAAVVVGLDQLTKHLVRTGIDPGETHKFLPGIQLVHVRNTGVAFSLFSGGGTVVLVFTLVALAVLLGYFTMRPSRPWLWLPTGLLIQSAYEAPSGSATARSRLELLLLFEAAPDPTFHPVLQAAVPAAS